SFRDCDQKIFWTFEREGDGAQAREILREVFGYGGTRIDRGIRLGDDPDIAARESFFNDACHLFFRHDLRPLHPHIRDLQSLHAEDKNKAYEKNEDGAAPDNGLSLLLFE